MGQQGEGEVPPRQALPRGPLLDPPKNIRVSAQPTRRDPLRGPQSDLPTNIRVRSHSYQSEWRGPNTLCPIRSLVRDNSRQCRRGPVVDLSWRYLPPTFSLGKIYEKMNFLSIVTIQSFSCQILRLYVICECII